MAETAGLATPKGRRTFVTVTSEDYLPALREDATNEGGTTNWSLSRNARRGDRVLLYVKAPVMAIVAESFVETDPVLDDDPASTWYGQYFSDLYHLALYREPVTRDELLREFPQWRYWKQPRQSVMVPHVYDKTLNELLKRHW